MSWIVIYINTESLGKIIPTPFRKEQGKILRKQQKLDEEKGTEKTSIFHLE